MKPTLLTIFLLQVFLLQFSIAHAAANIDKADATNAKLGWVPNDNTRTSSDILISCLAVLLVCTYKVVHLNISSPEESHATWHHFPFWKKWARKLKWIVFMACSPELLISTAIADWFWSRDSVKRFREAHAARMREPVLSRRHHQTQSSMSLPVELDKTATSIVTTCIEDKTTTGLLTMPRDIPLWYYSTCESASIF